MGPASIDPDRVAKQQKAQAEENSRTKQIANQWLAFSKTQAYEDFINYIDFHNEAAMMGAKGPVVTLGGENDQEYKFDHEKAAYLLQRSLAYDIVKSYVEGQASFSTLNK